MHGFVLFMHIGDKQWIARFIEVPDEVFASLAFNGACMLSTLLLLADSCIVRMTKMGYIYRT